MVLELLFLGTGTSAGVPMIGCDCKVCRSDDPRDQRSRASVLISYPDGKDPQLPPRRILVDTAPELRLQMVRHRISRIDGVFFTHAHADHIFGLDDLRRFNAVMGGAIDAFAEHRVLDRFEHMFPYIFQLRKNINNTFVPQLLGRSLEPGGAIDLHGATWTPLRLLHGRLEILGFRVDWQGSSLAYCTDVSSFPPETYPHLENLDLLVIDGLRYRHHPTHLTISQALEQIEQIKPGRAFLTHIAHDIMHAELDSKLPENVCLSYDGLNVQCS